MKRQLSTDEKKLSQSSVDRITKEVNELADNLLYNKALIDKQEYLRAFDNTWRYFLRKQKDKDDLEILDKMQILIDQKRKVIEELLKQIKDGVEKPSSVE